MLVRLREGGLQKLPVEVLELVERGEISGGGNDGRPAAARDPAVPAPDVNGLSGL
jgi:hypothetical protein